MRGGAVGVAESVLEWGKGVGVDMQMSGLDMVGERGMKGEH